MTDNYNLNRSLFVFCCHRVNYSLQTTLYEKMINTKVRCVERIKTLARKFLRLTVQCFKNPKSEPYFSSLDWKGKTRGKKWPTQKFVLNLAIDIFASRLVIHKKKQRWLVVSLYLFHLCDFNCLFFYVPETKYHLKSSTGTLFCYKRKFYSSIYIFFSCWITRDFEPWKGSERI